MSRRLAAGILLLAATGAGAATQTQIHWVMGTYFRITADGAGAADAMRECFTEARRADRTFSRFDAGSELSRVNRDGAERPSAEMEALLRAALRLGARTGGAFDVSAGALTALWRMPASPPPSALAAARASVGGVRLRDGQVTLARGTRLDFDGIAKGWAVDACVARLREHGIARALVSLGESSLYALGAPAGDTAWRLDLRGLEPDRAVGELRLRDRAASVSSTHGADGARPHIVDPRTGRLVGARAVAVVAAPSATEAEAYSKALLVWGDAGIGRVEALGDVQAARVTTAGVASGAAMRRGGGAALASFDAPRPLGRAEEGLP